MRVSCYIRVIRNVFFQTIRLGEYSTVKGNRNPKCIIMTIKADARNRSRMPMIVSWYDNNKE